MTKPTTIPAGTVAGSATVPDVETPMGTLEVAELLGVKDRTVHQWLRRNLMPEEDFPRVNGSRAWKRSTILRWAGRTGRLAAEAKDLRAEYLARWGADAIAPRAGGRLATDGAKRRRTPAEKAAAPVKRAGAKAPAKKKAAAKHPVKKAPSKKAPATKAAAPRKRAKARA